MGVFAIGVGKGRFAGLAGFFIVGFFSPPAGGTGQRQVKFPNFLQNEKI